MYKTLCILFIFNILISLGRCNGNSLNDPSITVFPQPTSQYFGSVKKVEHILIDPIHKRVYVAAINKVFSLSLDLQTVYKVINKPPEKCLSATVCETNFIKALTYDLKGRIYVCGTNNEDPKCWWFQREDLKQYDALSIYGTERIPSKSSINAVTFYNDQFLFTASLFGEKHKIQKLQPRQPNGGPDNVLIRTANSVLTNPTFISAHTIDDSGYVYFFFHEDAIEEQSRKLQHSRVARVCKYEEKGDFLGDKFLTFLKSHLVCKKKGTKKDYYYYYDELKSTYLVDFHSSVKSDSFIYGVFGMTAEDAGSSAICRYRVKDIIRVMETSPYQKKEGEGLWKSFDFSDDRNKVSRPKCNETATAPGDSMMDASMDALKNVLLYESITPYDGQPLFTVNVGLTSIVVDDFHVNDGDIEDELHVIFTGATNGSVYKISVNGTAPDRARQVDRIDLFQTVGPIYTLEKYNGIIYAGGKSGAAAMAVQRCSNYLLCGDCLNSQDPYCVWNAGINGTGQCIAVKDLPAADSGQASPIYDDVAQCPKVVQEFDCQVRITEAKPGKYATLKCTTSSTMASFRPQIVDWSRRDQRLYAGTLYALYDGKSTLFIKNFNEETAGKYECIIEFKGERKKCGVLLEAPTTETTTLRPHVNTNVTVNVTERVTTTVTLDKVPKQGSNTESYHKEFIIMAVLFAIMFVLTLFLLCLVLTSRCQTNGNTELDGAATNSQSNGHLFGFPFKKKYPLNRNDSANKELIKNKNKNRVYKPTTIEMTEKTNGVGGTEPV